MPTICELKISARAKGITGYSGMNKADLMKLIEGGVSKPKASKKAPAPAPEKKKTTKATSANLNALYKAGKKKVLAIKYTEPPKPAPVKSAKAKGKEPMKKADTVKNQVRKLVSNSVKEAKKTDEGKAKIDDLNEALMKHTLDNMANDKYKNMNIEDRTKLAQVLVANLTDDNDAIEYKGMMIEYQMLNLMIKKAKTKDKLNEIIENLASKDVVMENIKKIFLKDTKFKKM